MVEIDRIYTLAKEKGLSNSFLCKKIGKSTSYLNDAKNGKHGISDADLSVLADILDTTTDYLQGKTDKKEKAAPISGNGFDKKQYEFFKRFNTLDADLKNLLYQVESLDNEGQQIVSALVSRLAKSQEK